jgi:cysteine-rich repeat protein
MKTRQLLSLLIMAHLVLGSCQLLLDRFGPERCSGQEEAVCEGEVLRVCGPDNFFIFDSCDLGCLSLPEGDACDVCGNDLVADPAFQCDDGKQCDDGEECLEDADCFGQGDERCLPRDNDACPADCILPICGDGSVESNKGERCDDGNSLAGDGCRADCLGLELCVDGQIDTVTGEECDDNNSEANDGCAADCKLEVCGDGLFNNDEVCDDGNTVAGDGCRADCKGIEECGDGQIDSAAGETCDDSNTNGGDGCSSLCLSENCGNGLIDDNEECEDGNALNGDGCDANCLSTCTNLGGKTHILNTVNPEKNHCYILKTQIKNQAQALADCATLNSNLDENPVGHLVTITDAQENLFVRNLDPFLPLWIGLTDLTTEAQFRWFNGERLSYFINFALNQPDNTGDCVQFFAGDLSWDDTDCALAAPYVCEIDFGKECGNGISEDNEKCDDGNNNNSDGCNAACSAFSCSDEASGSLGSRTLAFSDSCYVLFSGAAIDKTWDDANQDCITRGGHLATIRNGSGSGTEQAIIAQLEDLTLIDIWIGFNDQNIEGVFQWETGEPTTFIRFDTGEPNNAGGDEDCIELDNDTDWNDENCAAKDSYLCEF